MKFNWHPPFQNLPLLDFILSLGPWWHLVAVSYLVANTLWLAQNIFKVVVYLRIPYERRKKGSKAEQNVVLEKEEKCLLKEDWGTRSACSKRTERGTIMSCLRGRSAYMKRNGGRIRKGNIGEVLWTPLVCNGGNCWNCRGTIVGKILEFQRPIIWLYIIIIVCGNCYEYFVISNLLCYSNGFKWTYFWVSFLLWQYLSCELLNNLNIETKLK